mgnify:CR=1 FL=1
MQRLSHLIIFLTLLCLPVLAQAEKTNFEVAGKKAYVVTPEKAAPGNPWVWRGRFPDWHPGIDQILLDQGYHIAYIDVANLYGNAEAVAIWDAFYAHCTTELKLNAKVALESTSRGGLIVYNWAKVNPEKVACIYLESPVCDLTSWPGGLGKGKGSPGDWKQAQKAHGITKDNLADFDGSPIHNLDALAKAGVPILHLAEDEDHIVPPAENTYLLQERYRALGGTMHTIRNEAGPRNAKGHHFPLENAPYYARFILKHSLPDEAKVPDTPHGYTYYTLRGGLENSRIRFESNDTVRVAFLGGSITQNSGWRTKLMEAIPKRFPNATFEFIPAGISSMGSTPGAFRLDRDVLSKGPIDLLFVEAAVNDSTNFRASNDQVRGVEGIVRHARSVYPNIDIVQMHFVDPDKMGKYNDHKIPEVIQCHERVADFYNVPSLNLAQEVTERIAAGEFTWEGDFKDLHPSPFGQEVYFKSMMTMLEAGWSNASRDAIQAHALPKTMVDPSSYTRAHLVAIESTTDLNGFTIDPNWHPKAKIGTRAGFVNVPMLVAEEPGASLSFAFNGNAVGIWAAAGPDAGTIEYSIDEGDWQTQDLYTHWSGGLHLPWAYLLGQGLDEGAHTLKLRMTDQQNPKTKGHALRMTHFLVNGDK